MIKKNFYNKFHGGIKLKKRLIKKSNFTYRNLLRLVTKYTKGSKNALDIGCGTGTISLYLANKKMYVVGVDISINAISQAKKNAKFLQLDSKTKFYQLDFPKKIPGGKFDLIICSEVLEHLDNDQVAVQQIHKLLKNRDSRAIISVPSLNAPLYKMGFLRDFDKRVGHLRRYSPNSLAELFRKHGFRVLNSEKTEGILRNLLFTNGIFGVFVKFLRGPLADGFTFLDKLTIKLFGESQLFIVVAKK